MPVNWHIVFIVCLLALPFCCSLSYFLYKRVSDPPIDTWPNGLTGTYTFTTSDEAGEATISASANHSLTFAGTLQGGGAFSATIPWGSATVNTARSDIGMGKYVSIERKGSGWRVSPWFSSKSAKSNTAVLVPLFK
jgi:hypothetical protein